jgi:hypothetical protein
MCSLERKISATALATALAKNPTLHRHSSARTAPIPIGAPMPPRPEGKWPLPAYVIRRKFKALRAEKVLLRSA